MNTLPESIKARIEDEAEYTAQILNFDRSGVMPSYKDGLRNGYTAAAEAILSNPQAWGLAGAWVRANERLPTFGKTIYIKHKGKPYIAQTTDEAKVDQVPRIAFYFDLELRNGFDYDNIEWLDESATPSDRVQQLEQALREIARLAGAAIMPSFTLKDKFFEIAIINDTLRIIDSVKIK